MPEIRVYADESSLHERYFLLGAIWLEDESFKNEIRNLRVRNAPAKANRFEGEFKWTKVSKKYLSIYQELVDIFFEGLKDEKIRYACLILDTKDKKVLEYGNYLEEGYFKLYYQLIIHNCKKIADYKIITDSISKKDPQLDLEELERCLHYGLRKKFGIQANVLSIQTLDSKASNIIQLVDLITGALACSANDHFKKKDASKARVSLMRYILARAEREDYIKINNEDDITAKKSDIFNIWPFKPKR